MYNQPFRASFDKLLDRYKTGISMTNVNAAQAMTDEIKDIAKESLKDYQKNMEETNKLLVTSQEMNMLAKDYQKNAQTMEDVQRGNSWWYGSKQCIAMFVAIFIVIVVLYLWLF